MRKATDWALSGREPDLLCHCGKARTVVQVISYWELGESSLHIAGLHLSSQGAVPVFAVAEPNTAGTQPLPRQVFWEEMTGWGIMTPSPKGMGAGGGGGAFYWVRRFKCRNLGSAGLESMALVKKEPRRPPKKDPDLALTLCFGSCKHLLLIIMLKGNQKKNGVREEKRSSVFYPTNKPCFVFTKAIVLTRIEEFCTAAAKYKDEDQLANKFKGSLYPLLCSAKGLRLKKVLGTALSPSSSLTQAHTPVCTQ